MHKDRMTLLVGSLLAGTGVLTGCPTPTAVDGGPDAAPYAIAAKPTAPGGGKPPKDGGGGGGSGGTITIDAAAQLHLASPLVMGFNRNHSHGQFAYFGISRDPLIQAVRATKPAWGGEYLEALGTAGYPVPAQPTYTYRTGHGPTDGRTDHAYMRGYFFQQMWNLDGQYPSALYPNDRADGYPYDDMRYTLKEAEDMGAGLLVTVNFGTDTAESAGKLAGYLNGTSDSLRQQYPFTASPFGMASDAPRRAYMFEIGNELSHTYALGHSTKATSIAQYMANAAGYISAIRAASPHPVKIAVDSAVNIYWGAQSQWKQRGEMVKELIDQADQQGVRIDALQAHLYPSWPVNEPLAGNAYTENFLTSTVIPALNEKATAGSPNANLEIWNNELHAASGSTTRNTGIYGALFQADATVLAFKLGRNGKQLIPVVTDFAWWHAKTNYDSLYFQDDSPSKQTPLFHFRRLLATNWGDRVLDTQLAGVGSWTDTADDGTVTVVSNLSTTSALSRDGQHLYVLVVNRSKSDEAVRFTLNGFSATSATMHRIKPSSKVRKVWDAAWNQVVVEENLGVNLAEPVAFPRASISLLKLSR